MSQNTLISDLLEKATKASKKNDFSNYAKDLIEAYRIRCVEQKFLELFSEAKISGTVHTSVGQELTGVVLSKYLDDYDWITSNHRCHGHYIARTNDWKGLIDELVGLKTGVSKGIGSSQHLLKDKFISNGTQGSLLPVATGIGISIKRRKNQGIVVSFIGEGTFGEGVLYEALNLSSLFQSPHLIICENNYYSQSTPQKSGISGSINNRAKAFDWEIFETNTWDLHSLNDVTSKAVEFVRSSKKPAFLRIDTYRLLAHSKGDDDRPKKEIASFAEIDLVNMFLKSGIANVELKSIYNEIKTYTDKILSNPKRISYAEYSKDQLPRGINVRMKEINNDNISMVKALSRGYRFCLEEKDAIFIGEDIADPYGGAFKVTKGFQDSHPNNVYSTSISEAGLVGIAIGMSLDGHKAFAEIMFGDFMMNCMDQIVNNASKFHHMYGKQIFSDIVIRTPMGGRRGYGPTHSQSLEKFLLGIDNTMVAAVSSLKDPLELIKELNNINCPKIVIENKTDYSNFLYNPVKNLLLENIGEALGTARLSPIGGKSTLLIIAYGYVARLIADNYVKIFKESDCVFTLICPQLLHPIPIDHFKQDAKKIKHILLVEESTAGFGWADGVASAFLELDEQFKIFKLSSDPVPIPSNRDLEALNLVSIEKIIEKISLIKEHYDRS